MTPEWLSYSALGLGFDAVGVIVLGLSSLLERPAGTRREAQTYWDGNEPLLERLVASKYDISTGSALLLTGFCLQVIGLYVKANLVAAIALLVLIIALPVAYLLFLRRKLIKRYMDEVQLLEKSSSTAKEG